MGPGRDNRAVERIDELGNFRRRACSDLADRGQPMLLVAGVDALRAVAGKEIRVELEPRVLLQDRHAHLFGAAGIYRRFVYDDIALLQDLRHRLARLDERCQVGPLVVVDRRRHRDDEHAARLEICGPAGEPKSRRRLQFCSRQFEGAVLSCLELGDALRLDVKTDGMKVLAEFGRKRQPHIAQTNDADPTVPQGRHALTPMNSHLLLALIVANSAGSRARIGSQVQSLGIQNRATTPPETWSMVLRNRSCASISSALARTMRSGTSALTARGIGCTRIWPVVSAPPRIRAPCPPVMARYTS